MLFFGPQVRDRMVQGKMCILRKDYFGVFFEIFFPHLSGEGC